MRATAAGTVAAKGQPDRPEQSTAIYKGATVDNELYIYGFRSNERDIPIPEDAIQEAYPDTAFKFIRGDDDRPMGIMRAREKFIMDNVFEKKT